MPTGSQFVDAAGPNGPAGRAVPLGDLCDDVELVAHRELVSAVLGGAGDVERTRGVEIRDGLVGVPTRPFRRGGALAQCRPQGADLLEDRAEGVGIHGGGIHHRHLL